MEIVVVGAGPAGLMAAAGAKNDANNVTIIDSNDKVGKKLYITGKGRCNVTNNIAPNDFFANVVNNSKFLYSAIYRFSPQDAMDLIESQGTKLKTERGNRVFPVSDKASDIIKALKTYTEKQGVNIELNTKALDISKQDDKFVIKTSKDKKIADVVVIATGGKSYPTTGSSGDGYIFAKKLGHKIIAPRAALVPIDLQNFNSSLSGISLKNVTASIEYNGKTYTEFGEMLFTHTGVSGPIILSLSSYVNKGDIKGAKLTIDLKPALSEKQLEERLLRDFKQFANKDFKNYVAELLPKNLIPEFLKRLSFAEYTKVNSITKENRQEIIHLLKHFDFLIAKLKEVELGIVTAGGVDTKEVSPNTMESKLVKNLYFIGEVLDVDAVTGGFNIQIALSTGYLAGQDIATKEG